MAPAKKRLVLTRAQAACLGALRGRELLKNERSLLKQNSVSSRSRARSIGWPIRACKKGSNSQVACHGARQDMPL